MTGAPNAIDGEDGIAGRAEQLLRRVAADRLPVDSGAVALMAALIREAHEAGRQSLRDDQEALASEVLGMLEAEEPTQPGTAGALHDFLVSHPRDRKVILRKDAEGNGHSPLAEAWEALYVADTTYSGEVYPTAEDVAGWVAEGIGGPDDWTVPDDGERVIVLGPVN